MDKSNKKFWDKWANHYTAIQEKQNQELYNYVCSYIKNYLDKNMVVLELACGTGQFSLPLHESVKYYLATDYSDKMIANLNKISKHDDLATRVMDATNTKCKDNTFDAVIIANALHIMPNPELALKEIHRILKPNGLLIAPTFVYEGKINKFKLKILEIVGFKSFSKWTSSTFKDYVESFNYHVLDNKLIPGKMVPECVLIANKK